MAMVVYSQRVTTIKCRHVAEVFGRVFILTAIGAIKYERRRGEPLGGSGDIPPENFEI